MMGLARGYVGRMWKRVWGGIGDWQKWSKGKRSCRDWGEKGPWEYISGVKGLEKESGGTFFRVDKGYGEWEDLLGYCCSALVQ